MDNFSKNDTSINLVTNMNSILQDIFSLKDDFSDDEELKYCFKILLFDDKVFNILSPLLKIYYLREHNISLTLNIKDNREKMSDIMAIYIVTLTKENLDYIFNDIKNQIFDNFCINFISFDTSDNSNKKILDEFYTKTSNLENNSSIYKISIIPIDICLYHPKIFSLNLKRPYLLLNSPNISDDIYQKYLSKISIGLFSALYLMKTYPVVKYHKGFFGDDIIKKIQNEFNYLFKMCPDSKEDFKFSLKFAYIIMALIFLGLGGLLSVEKNYRSRYPVPKVYSDLNAIWSQEYKTPLKYFGGYIEWTLPLTIYGKDHQQIILDTKGYKNPWIDEEDLKKSGIMIIGRDEQHIFDDTMKSCPYLDEDYEIIPEPYSFEVKNAFGQKRQYDIFYYIVPPQK